ncbi:MAG TPA: hypothetical protein VN415_08760 [Dehalococcoidia bacterium]|nr:hypothetical protein [Dehalococcoidia bacterium]
MGSSTGQKVGEVIITALWPLIWVIYVLVGLVIFVEAAAVYLSWGIVVRLDRVLKKTRTQPAG